MALQCIYLIVVEQRGEPRKVAARELRDRRRRRLRRSAPQRRRAARGAQRDARAARVGTEAHVDALAPAAALAPFAVAIVVAVVVQQRRVLQVRHDANALEEWGGEGVKDPVGGGDAASPYFERETAARLLCPAGPGARRPHDTTYNTRHGHDTTRQTRHDTTRHDTARHGTARHGTTRHDTTRHTHSTTRLARSPPHDAGPGRAGDVVLV